MNERILKSELAKKAMTQKDLAKALNITESTMVRKINGKSEFSTSEIKKITEVFQLPITSEFKDLFFSDSSHF